MKLQKFTRQYYGNNILTGMFILVSREGTMFGKCFFTPITEIKTLLIFRCCRGYFRLWCSFALALRVRLILILKDNTQIIRLFEKFQID